MLTSSNLRSAFRLKSDLQQGRREKSIHFKVRFKN